MGKKGITIKCNCEGCSNIVYVKPFQVNDILNGIVRKFCSYTCSGKTTRNKKKTGVEKNCLNCKKTIYVQKNQNTYSFCSVPCANEYRTNKPLHKKRNSLNIICYCCGKTFIVQKHREHTAKYCSINCSSLHTLSNWKRNRYNPESIPKIEEIGKKYGYNFQHALNGGEKQIPNTRYFVDGYDLKNNIVIEYDERHHFDKNGNLKHKDIIRQNKIMEEINCLFIRIDYKNEIKIYEKPIFTF